MRIALGYVEGLKKLYPDHPSIPQPCDVLEWQRDYQAWVNELRADYSENAVNAASRAGARQSRIEALGNSLRHREQLWSPPPHLSAWKTPVPERYFRLANCGCASDCGCAPWNLNQSHASDLVPHEQWNLVQDVLPSSSQSALPWNSIVSADARACLSLCRPCGHYVKKRQMRHRGVGSRRLTETCTDLIVLGNS